MTISIASLALISQVAGTKRSPLIEVESEERLNELIEIPFKGLTIAEDYSFQAYRPLKAVVENDSIRRLEFKVYPPLNIPLDSANTRYVSQPSLLQQKIIGSAFVHFFELIRDKIETKYSSNTLKWPDDLNFARVIRNAYSHGGNIHFLSPTAGAVSWRGLTYSPSNNGKSIHTDLYVGEIIELMKDIEIRIT